MVLEELSNIYIQANATAWGHGRGELKQTNKSPATQTLYIRSIICYLIAMILSGRGQTSPLPVPVQLHLSKENIPNKKQKQIPERQWLSMTNQKV